MSFVNLNQIYVSYDGKRNVLEGLDLAIEEGELVSLLGPSGCGKTTTLRVVAGFCDSQSGSFILDGQDMTKVPVHKRNFGIVFQSYALFPHLNVYDNVAFGLRMRKMDEKTIQEKVRRMLQICGLEEFEKRFPKEMSGGQRQRVALARALVIEPKLLLLDEPLSNLDAKLRVSMRTEIKRIQKQMGITTIFVTHDQEECFSISDRVAIMNEGVIEQYDTPEHIYSKPVSEFVARFIGFENFIELTHDGENFRAKNGAIMEFGTDYDPDLYHKATIRPDDIEILESNEDGTNHIEGTIGIHTFLGKCYQYEVHTEVGEFLVNSISETPLEEGKKVMLNLPSAKLIALKN